MPIDFPSRDVDVEPIVVALRTFAAKIENTDFTTASSFRDAMEVHLTGGDPVILSYARNAARRNSRRQ